MCVTQRFWFKTTFLMGGEAGGQPCEGQQRGLTLSKKKKNGKKKTLISESCSTNTAILFSVGAHIQTMASFVRDSVGSPD